MLAPELWNRRVYFLLTFSLSESAGVHVSVYRVDIEIVDISTDTDNLEGAVEMSYLKCPKQFCVRCKESVVRR